MLTCSSDQECTLRMNLLIVHTSYAKWPQSTYTVLFSENMNPKDVPQEPAVLQVLKSLQHHNSAPLKWEPSEDESQEWEVLILSSFALGSFALQTHFCCTTAFAKISIVEISDLHFVVSSEHGTGQACLVTSENVESSLFCMGPSWVSLSCFCQWGERHVEENSPGETLWVAFPQGEVGFDHSLFLQSWLEMVVFTSPFLPGLRHFKQLLQNRRWASKQKQKHKQ